MDKNMKAKYSFCIIAKALVIIAISGKIPRVSWPGFAL